MSDDPLMGTGHRDINHPDPLLRALHRLLESGVTRFVVSGGAAGADTLLAQAADDVGVPFGVLLPNRRYLDKYPGAIGRRLLDRAVWVRFAVDRPDVADWQTRWGAERWWTDNFRRNAAMGEEAVQAVVMSRPNPVELLDREVAGGTAHCVRTLAAQGYEQVWWVPDRVDAGVERVWLTAQSSLF